MHFVAQEVSLKLREVTGILAALWRSTQERKVATIGRDEFSRYAQTWDLEREDSKINKKLIESFLFHGFLEEDEDDQLIVVGNDKHIRNIETARENARKNGRKSGGRPKKKTETEPMENQDGFSEETSTGFENNQDETETEPTKKPIQSNTLQFNTKQSSAEQLRPLNNFKIEDFQGELKATPAEVKRLWDFIIFPLTDIPSPDFKIGDAIHEEITRSLRMMPLANDWRNYFTHVAMSDWYVNRASSFYFASVVKWENVSRQMASNRPKKTIDEISQSAREAGHV